VTIQVKKKCIFKINPRIGRLPATPGSKDTNQKYEKKFGGCCLSMLKSINYWCDDTS
jgi:hypothetical protein